VPDDWHRQGETGWTAHLIPLTVDGLIWASSMVMLDSARRGVRVPVPRSRHRGNPHGERRARPGPRPNWSCGGGMGGCGAGRQLRVPDDHPGRAGGGGRAPPA
jgi:hypothetical protein